MIEILYTTLVECMKQRMLQFLVFPFEGMMILALCHVAPHSEIIQTQ